jgi:uncharacterized membrane protein
MQPTFTPLILAHTIAAFAAVGLGAAMFAARKGTLTHRLAGRSWVALMLAVALSSFWIQRSGQFSWIHGLSVIVILMLGAAVVFARSGRIRGHRRMVIGLYAGGLLLTGFFTLLPHRLLGRLVWSSLGLN